MVCTKNCPEARPIKTKKEELNSIVYCLKYQVERIVGEPCKKEDS